MRPNSWYLNYVISAKQIKVFTFAIRVLDQYYSSNRVNNSKRIVRYEWRELFSHRNWRQNINRLRLIGVFVYRNRFHRNTNEKKRNRNSSFWNIQSPPTNSIANYSNRNCLAVSWYIYTTQSMWHFNKNGQF